MELKKLTYMSIFVAIMGVLGLLPPIPLAFSPVPLTLQTLGVMLSGSILGYHLGGKYAFMSLIVFLLLVLSGLPLLAGGRGGVGVFVVPSSGYLIGYAFGSYVVGWFAERIKSPSFFRFFIANTLGGVAVVYLFGIPVQAFMMEISLIEASILSLVYLPGDLVKVIIASMIGLKMTGIPLMAKEKTGVTKI
ncbi:biotin biosynthesis protein BioY [Halolactibacillus alkaliphilus]|uniref:Biotin transporter n=1 Tax=Halolactibacillus alkaliphilus TaxID=442899 RepID=A0A511X099_9BACI|nr:biotin transporter BioY [Halolactibacillus alkaliphilus]GEN56374.1 biotin biosynthesis protein BioY [Halolactibacillus alkaliphilus]GGN67462.1 biotin biosynthesis protein BioY [Halolactibacillus alkaliphilus]SFO92031.1 biotin transport system substrate-specific component [Halolactibacillus alkaliphilus]